MKKLLTTLALFAALTLTACGGSNQPAEESKPAEATSEKAASSKHEHTFDESKWESNETQHWHPATCEHTTQKGSAAKHEFVEVTAESVAPTCSQPGKKVEECSVCHYKKETVLTAEHDLQPVEHAQGEGEVAETIRKCSKDNYYQIDFRADDAAAELNNTSDRKSDGYVKLSKQVAADGTGTASYIQYKIYSPVALTGRFWIDITGNTSNIWTRDNTSGAQSLYYTYNDTTTNINTWKNKVELNGVEVDFENATYKIGEQDVKFAELTYSDFGELASAGGATISVPMPTMTLNAGVNTLKFTRLTGYAFNMHTFSFKADI